MPREEHHRIQSPDADADACWLFDSLKASPNKRDIKIGRGTHLIRLETMRTAIYRESVTFLDA